MKLELNDLKAENKALKDILQKNGLEAPENEAATDEAIFQSQTAISAVEMQETINKENLKRNANKHAGSVDQPEPVQEVVPSSESPAAAAEPVDNNSAVNKESEVVEAPVVPSEPVQEPSVPVPEANTQEEKSAAVKDGEDNNSAEVKPDEEAAN